MTSSVSTSQPDLAAQSQPVALGLLELLGAVRMFSIAMEQLVETKVQRQIAGDRLSRSQWKLLEMFALSDVRNVTDLATYQGVSTAAASKAADRLVRMGLLTREEDLEDRRHIHLQLSPEGQRITKDYLSALQERIAKVFVGADALLAPRLAGEIDDLTAATAATREEMEQVCLQCAINRHEPCLIRQRMGATCAYALHHRGGSPLTKETAAVSA
ncbi:MAG: MarR family transcriptional regulator [Bryobacterales bacterium]|nr:MarR family transcriptional regulator [Bryobacterales bacterium]